MTPQPPNPPPDDTRFTAEVARLYGADLQWFLLNRLQDEQDARDVMQEVYLRLLRLRRSDLVEQPRAYVYFVARQVLAQFRLRARRDPATYDTRLMAWHDRHPEDVQQDAVVDRLMALSEAQALLEALPATHRKVFALRTFEGLSWTQIAQKLSLSAHTVKKYLAEANARISVMRREQ